MMKFGTPWSGPLGSEGRLPKKGKKVASSKVCQSAFSQSEYVLFYFISVLCPSRVVMLFSLPISIKPEEAY